MSELDETVRDFLVESFENLDQLDRDLVDLETNSGNPEIINRIFRIVHTVKGTCGFFSFGKLEGVSHVGENLLDNLRSSKIAVTEEIVSALLSLSDALRSLLLCVEQTGSDGFENYDELKALLTDLNNPLSKTQDTANKTRINNSTDSSVVEIVKKFIDQAEGQETEVVTIETSSDASLSPEDELLKIFEAEQKKWAVTEQEQITVALPNQITSQNHQTEPENKTQECKAAPSPTVKNANTAPQSPPEENKKSELSETALRVDVHLLDKLMNLVGELVLARNQILQFTKSHSDGGLVSTSQRLNLITSELQEGVMRTRMQPIANVWNKLPRIVRDVAHTCGKQVRLEMHGKETELDKTIIEAIKDPLTHIIRNSVDHGVEAPDVRKSNGKNPEGVLSMKAFHEGGQVIIEITDDGAGLNVNRIRNKAIEKGLLAADKAASMSEQELQRLVFLPGLSTAEKVTNVSGRGVGMDVVRSNIERIGGTVDVSSKLGQGTTFTIKIPLTLAIIPALVVSASENRYAIPQVNLLELVRIDGEEVNTVIEEIHGSLFYRLRGRLLPVVFLARELGIASPLKSDSASIAALNVVIVRADDHQFGLVVDAIHDTEEIVVKPLGRLLKGISSFAGTTIMGDGQVALILDIVGIARRAKISKGKNDAQEKQLQANANNKDKVKLLLFEVNDKQRAAIPLEQVNRLEEFPVEKLEFAGGSTVVQYRDGILPLIDLNQALSGFAPEHLGSVRAFVYQNGQHLIGFIVRRIVDIIEQEVTITSPYKRNGLVGSAIIQEKVTDIVDISSIIKSSDLQYYESSEEAWRI